MRRNSPRTIVARFPGRCAFCRAPIAAGETVDYYPASKQIAHVGGLDGSSARCAAGIRKEFIDVDALYEDQCAAICGR